MENASVTAKDAVATIANAAPTTSSIKAVGIRLLAGMGDNVLLLAMHPIVGTPECMGGVGGGESLTSLQVEVKWPKNPPTGQKAALSTLES